MHFQAHARPGRRPYAIFAVSLSLCALFAAAAIGADPQPVPPPPEKPPETPPIVDPPQIVLPPIVVVRPPLIGPEEGNWRPATQPAGALHAQIAKAFAELADAQPTVRDTARRTLMDLARQDLTSLEKVVRQSLPLAPAQQNALKEIVFHARGAQVAYNSAYHSGFLGVQLSPVIISTSGRPQNVPVPVLPQDVPFPDEFPGDRTATAGVLIADRMLGFPGERAFMAGDIIVGFFDPDRPQQHTPIHTTEDLRDKVIGSDAGHTVEFLVLRQGEFSRVSVTLDPTPSNVSDVKAIVNQRRLVADEYWTRVFLPMLRSQVQ